MSRLQLIKKIQNDCIELGHLLMKGTKATPATKKAVCLLGLNLSPREIALVIKDEYDVELSTNRIHKIKGSYREIIDMLSREVSESYTAHDLA